LAARPDFWAESAIDMRLGHPVTAIDRAARTVTVAGEASPMTSWR
jgi:3-phenylpropionate/trans-cinnamate dioxygenase ferredoxin reductase subunit